jgi:hypothetical protein
MWWLSFRRGVVIIESTSLAQARLLATSRGLGHPSHFAKGHSISPELASLIPDDCVGRMLSREQVRELLQLVRSDTRTYVGSSGSLRHPVVLSR